MEKQRITAEQLLAELQPELKQLAQEMAQAMNQARPGRIIADSEEPVRDAHALFRQQAYQRALELLQKQTPQEAFSPSSQPAAAQVAQQRAAEALAPHGQRTDRVQPQSLLE